MFHALSNHFQRERVGHVNDGAHDGLVPAAAPLFLLLLAVFAFPEVPGSSPSSASPLPSDLDYSIFLVIFRGRNIAARRPPRTLIIGKSPNILNSARNSRQICAKHLTDAWNKCILSLPPDCGNSHSSPGRCPGLLFFCNTGA